MPDWQIRKAVRADSGSAEEFLRFLPEFSEGMEDNQEKGFWNWLFVRRESDPELVYVGEDKNSKIIAHYGIARFSYKVHGKSAPSGIICSFAVGPNYRTQNISALLSFKLLQSYRSNGLEFLTCLSHRKGMREFHSAFGFKEIGRVSVFAKPYRFLPISKKLLPKWLYFLSVPVQKIGESVWRSWVRLQAGLYHSFRGDFGVEIKKIDSFDQRYDSIDESLSRTFQFTAERNSQTLNWRFFENPFRKYSVFEVRKKGVLAGYFALREMKMMDLNALAVVDLCFDLNDSVIARSVFRIIDQEALARNCHLATAIGGAAQLRKHLRRNFYLKTPEKLAFLIHESKGSSNAAIRSRIEEWFISWFDHDYV